MVINTDILAHVSFLLTLLCIYVFVGCEIKAYLHRKYEEQNEC